MNKQFAFFLFVLIFITFVSAESFPQNQDVQFIKSCTNSSGSICSNIATCNVTVKAPVNNTLLVNNKQMNNNQNGLFNYTLSSTINSVRGDYTWDMFCCDSTDCGEAHGTYLVTINGEEVNPQKAFISIAMIVLLVFLFILSLFVYSRLPSSSTIDDNNFGLNTNNLKYFRPVMLFVAYGILVGIVFVSSNLSYQFLDNNLVGQLLFRIFLIMGYAIPLIIIILFLVALMNMLNDKTLKKNLERGFDLGGQNF